jgi:hypothetical protein
MTVLADIPCSFLCFPRQMLGQSIKISHNLFVSHCSQLVTNNHSTIASYRTCAVEKASLNKTKNKKVKTLEPETGGFL